MSLKTCDITEDCGMQTFQAHVNAWPYNMCTDRHAHTPAINKQALECGHTDQSHQNMISVSAYTCTEGHLARDREEPGSRPPRQHHLTGPQIDAHRAV